MSDQSSNRRFHDCALIEIIHLHDCLRGALRELERDVTELSRICKSNSSHAVQSSGGGIDNNNGSSPSQEISDLEKRVAGRFQVIWSVFRAHSAAEDEFIWPALENKMKEQNSSNNASNQKCVRCSDGATDENSNADSSSGLTGSSSSNPSSLVQEEYVEDHADEEKMFLKMNSLLSQLRDMLSNKSLLPPNQNVHELSRDLRDLTSDMSVHLIQHLEKEEVQCMPLVEKHLSKQEINDLVGQIMGKRSSDMMSKILLMAVHNLPLLEREEMVKYMKQAMVGTFFEKWLRMGGLTGQDMDKITQEKEEDKPNDTVKMDVQVPEEELSSSTQSQQKQIQNISQGELQNLIRAIAANPELTAEKKTTTIQGLRDSVWKSQQQKRKREQISRSPEKNDKTPHKQSCTRLCVRGVEACCERRMPPAHYYKKNKDGQAELIWTSDSSTPPPLSMPLFSATELAPTYHDGATASVLGCPHYARSCKLRHPSSGHLYTCRLCCEQQREMPLKNQDSPLDRYAVKELLCMRCMTLQPSDTHKCIQPKCEALDKPYSRYSCKICHFYDDGPKKEIYHCPYCNVCRSGKGLGIDYRHCMRCNACVSLKNGDDHICIPQRLQGTCPICREILFESTEPLRGLKCGHVMHLSCFGQYMRGPQTYTCPLCKKSIEDMREYFALLDTAVRMQPMPAAYENQVSKVYCQDCGDYGVVSYHFVGCKCCSCGSYNTREIERRERQPQQQI